MRAPFLAKLNIPTGIPLVYELREDLTPIRSYYLGDPAAVQKAAQAVADQLTGPGGIAPERVAQGDPGEADGDAPTAKLDLAAAGKRP